MNELDHLVWAGPDLFAAVADFEELTGVAPTPGGQHLGLGTRNFLASLGDSSYLEIIGPDPQQPEPSRARPFGIDTLDRPRLVAWAIRAQDLDERVAAARAAGWDPGNVVSMSRRRPDGVLLEWQLTIKAQTQVVEPVPFLIDWGATETPAATAVDGLELVELSAGHPEPESLAASLAAVGAELTIEAAAEPGLSALLRTPRGETVLS